MRCGRRPTSRRCWSIPASITTPICRARFCATSVFPSPISHLGIGSGSHAEQTGRVMIEYGRVAEAHRPDWLVVVGDVNSTVAARADRRQARHPHRPSRGRLALARPDHARGIEPARHRCGQRRLVDALARRRRQSHRRRGAGRAHHLCRQHHARQFRAGPGRRSRPPRCPPSSASPGTAYGVVTLHRPSNVDDPAQLARLARLPGHHPAPAAARLSGPSAHRRPGSPRPGSTPRWPRAGVRLIEPLPYVRFMSLAMGAAAIVTDSGGIQEETTYLGIPCFTLRENTERPITISQGTNRLATAASLPGLLETALGAPRNSPKPAQILGRKDRRSLRRRPAPALPARGSRRRLSEIRPVGRRRKTSFP